jgi:quinoprotein relay system zinc metallohydrolase 2
LKKWPRVSQWVEVYLRICTIIISILLLQADVAAQEDKSFTVLEIAPGLFAHEGQMALMDARNEGGTANIGFIIGDDSVAVIDTGGSLREGERLSAAIAHITGKPVRYVINTHEHPDHIFGNAAFEAQGVTFIGHKNLARALAARGAYYLQSFRDAMGDVLLKNVRLIAPSVTVEDEIELDLGHRVIILKAWPVAHTDCDLSVFDVQTKTLFAGDLVFLQHVPVIDGSLLGWIKALAPLSQIPARLVVPGHGPVGVSWPAAVEPERSYFLTLAKDLRAMINEGKDVAQAAQRAGQSQASQWQLFQDYNPRNATVGFAEIEWE